MQESAEDYKLFQYYERHYQLLVVLQNCGAPNLLKVDVNQFSQCDCSLSLKLGQLSLSF